LQNLPGFAAFYGSFQLFAGAIPGEPNNRSQATYEQRFTKVADAPAKSLTYAGPCCSERAFISS
jgi:hypothetical protein